MSNCSLTLPGEEGLWRASFLETCSMQSEQDFSCLWISLHLPLIWKPELSCPYQWPPGAVPWICSPGPWAVPWPVGLSLSVVLAIIPAGTGQGWSWGCLAAPWAAQAVHLEGHGRNNHPDTQNWKNPSRRTYLTSITQFLQDWVINKIIGKYLVGFCPSVSVQGWAISNQRGKYRPKLPENNKKQLQDPPLLLPHSAERGCMRGAGHSAVRQNNIYWGENNALPLQSSVEQILCLHQVK